jgi:serine/threonine protein kinase
MALTLDLNSEPIPGYRLTKPLGSGGSGEVWTCEAPGGILKALKVVRGNVDLNEDHSGFEQEWRALDHIKTIRHPFLLAMDRIEVIDGELVIVMELADKSLRNLFEEYQDAGHRGIPRDELLGYFREAAEALDLMNFQYGLQHLDIKPDNLFLVSNHIKVGDFGLVNASTKRDSSSSSTGELGGITPRYAAPERFHGQTASSCDQYSLAVAYQELLTGSPPFNGKNWRRLLLQHTREEPNLQGLSDSDRMVVARALSKESPQRFASCTEFVRALMTGQCEPPSARITNHREPPGPQAATVSAISVGPDRVDCPLPKSCPESVVHDSGSIREVPVSASTGVTCAAAPGYRFLDRVGITPLGETWIVQAPDGRERLLKFLHGFPGRDPRKQREAIRRLRSLRHRALPCTEVIDAEGARIVLITDLAETTLQGRARDRRSEGQMGIERRELLGYLRSAAEALDDLCEDQALHHLAINPTNLLLVEGRLRLGDFGLVQLFWTGDSQVGRLNARYSAPELFLGQMGRSCDQYSLALIYQEMLTGLHPDRNQPTRPGAGRPRTRKLDLDPLTAPDRVVVARALHPDPERRFPTCTEMINALEGATSEGDAAAKAFRSQSPSDIVAVESSVWTAAATGTTSPRETLSELVKSVAGPVQIHKHGNVRFLLHKHEMLEHRCLARLFPEIARLKLEGFRQEWKARLVRQEADDFYVFEVSLAGSFWQRCLKSEPELIVQVRFAQPLGALELTAVTIQVRPSQPHKPLELRALQDIGPSLLATLRSYLQPTPESRTHERFPCHHPLVVRPVFADLNMGEPVEGQCKDISLAGMRLWLPQCPPGEQICIHLPSDSDKTSLTTLALVRRAGPCSEGGYELGVRFMDSSS